MIRLIFNLLSLFIFHSVQAQSVKVMSFNIHHGADAKDKDQLDNMARFIKSSGADLVGLQEVDSVCVRSGNIDQMKRLAELTGMHYAFARHMAYDGGAYGQGILSKYPLSAIRNDRLTLLKKNGKKDSRALLSAKVNLPDKKKLLFASAHFALDSVTRRIQAGETTAYLKNNKMPVILTGDLNAEPLKKEVVFLNQYFSDADPLNAFTFPVDQPVKKIDYIFISKAFLNRVVDFEVLNAVKYSDHLPIMATVELGNKNKK